jgi:hypothetical protein
VKKDNDQSGEKSQRSQGWDVGPHSTTQIIFGPANQRYMFRAKE